MVVDANSTSTGILNLGYGEEGNYLVQNSLIVLQHDCEYRMAMETAGLWKSSTGMRPGSPGPGSSPAIQSAVLQPSDAQLQAVCFVLNGLLSRDTLSVSTHQGHTAFPLQWKRKVCSPNLRGVGLYGQKSLPRVLFHANKDSKSLQFDGSKGMLS